MEKNNQKPNVWSFFKKLPELMRSEVTTTFGRVNLISDIVLAAVVVAVFAASVLDRITIAIVSIWNKEIVEHLSNADTFVAFIILVIFFITCLVFLFVSEKIMDQHE